MALDDCEAEPVFEGDAPLLRDAVGLRETVELAVRVELGVSEPVPVEVPVPVADCVGLAVSEPVQLPLFDTVLEVEGEAP